MPSALVALTFIWRTPGIAFHFPDMKAYYFIHLVLVPQIVIHTERIMVFYALRAFERKSSWAWRTPNYKLRPKWLWVIGAFERKSSWAWRTPNFKSRPRWLRVIRLVRMTRCPAPLLRKSDWKLSNFACAAMQRIVMAGRIKNCFLYLMVQCLGAFLLYWKNRILMLSIWTISWRK